MKKYHISLGLPNPRELARALGGHVRADGSIAFPGPGRNRRDRSCTLTIDPGAPDGFVVADARTKAPMPWQQLKDHVRAVLGIPFSSSSKRLRAVG